MNEGRLGATPGGPPPYPKGKTVFYLDNKKVPNGTVLTMGIRYTEGEAPDPDATRGRTNPKVYTYALLKSGGLWYVTGTGKVPVAAGWTAVMRWLGRDGRVVEWARIMTESAPLYPPPPETPVEEPPYYDLPHR